MRPIGFSTGALAKGDFAGAIALLRQCDTNAIELSALRDHELAPLMGALDSLDLRGYDYVSVHAPSKLGELSESAVAELLSPCIERAWPVIVHPDVIRDPGCWRAFGRLLCVENMDTRKPIGRTAHELAPLFEQLPEASFCFDFGHARQVDSSLGVARDLLQTFGTKMLEMHLSEVDGRWHHHSLTVASVFAMRKVAYMIPPCPVILESMVDGDAIGKELSTCRSMFAADDPSSADGR